MSNRVREYRSVAGMTQAELAACAGISRTAVTAIEGERIVPSVATALALAEVLGASVEVLFGSGHESRQPPEWAWTPAASASLYWQAEVAGRHWMYPAETSPMWTPAPDGCWEPTGAGGQVTPEVARQTLVVACCDPAAGLLAGEYTRTTGFRMLVLARSSRQALELLREGKVHLAGVHFSTTDAPDANADAVRAVLGSGHQLLRIANWQEGVASAPGSRLKSVQSALRSKLQWVGREPGSGARQCLDQLLGNRPAPRHVARHHRGVAEAIATGWADAGVCLQLTSAEAGLFFLPVQEESYDLCISQSLLDDPRIAALLNVVRSVNYRQLLSQLPGYCSRETGSLHSVE